MALRTDEPAGGVAFVRVALPLDVIDRQLARLRGIVWTSAGATGLAGLALTFWLARLLMRPVGELTAAAELVAAGKYGSKVYAGGHDEFATLCADF